MTQANNTAKGSSNIDSSGVLLPSGGGTGAATLTANNVLLGNGTSAMQVVAPGTSGNLLTSTGTTWSSTAPAPGVLTGSLMMWPTGIAPTGYLLCNGAAVSRTTFSALFAIVSTMFGAGDGSTTFNLPNYTNRVPYGTTVGATGGTADAIVVSHTHAISDPGHNHSFPSNVPTLSGGENSQRCITDGGAFYTSTSGTGISVQTSGSSGTNQNLPPYLGINFIIKT